MYLKKFPVFIFLFLFALTARSEIRIGILHTEDLTQQAADVLTVSLSGLTNVVLLERAEVEKVFREQSLTSGTKTNFTRLGQLLHADGLILLQPIHSLPGTNFAVRLAAVNSGVVLDGAVYSLPLSDAEAWGKLVASRFAPLFPKLEVTRERAVPISLINLRSAVNTPTSIQTEQALSALLFHRLMLERDLFVLERRQMGKLAWEKNLFGADDKSFWSGAYLLEGVIDRDGVDRDTLTIHARLSPPNQGVPIDVEVSGPRRKATEIIEVLTSRILTAVQRQPSATIWNPDNEAERYEQEASWALRWKNWKEVYAAADSAYALGRRTDLVMDMKIRALIEQSHTPNTMQYHEGLRTWVNNLSSGGWIFDPIRNVGWNEKPPAPEVAPNALESLELYYSHSISTDTNKWRTNAPWLELGVYALQTASEVLRHHYFYSWRAEKFAESLPDLRAAARDVSRMLLEVGDFSTLRVPTGHSSKQDKTLMLEQVIGLSAPLWQELPDHSGDVYRTMMANGTFARVRTSIFREKEASFSQASARSWKNPFWVGWSRSDRERGEVVWQRFLSELQSSTNRTQRADAALLKLHDAVFDPDIAVATEEFYDAVMDENHFRFSAEIDCSVIDSFEAVLEGKGKATLRRQRLLAAWKEHSFARLKHIFQTAKTHDVDRVGWPVAQRFFSPEQASELIPVIADYRRRFPGGDWMDSVEKHIRKSAGNSSDAFTGFFASATHNPERLKQLFVSREFTAAEASRLAPELEQYARRFSWPDDVRSALTRLRNFIPAPVTNNTVATAVNTNVAVFNVNRYLKAVFKDPDSPRVFDSRFENLLERDGRLYAAIPKPQSTGREEDCVIVEIDLDGGRYTEIAWNVPNNLVRGIRYEIFNDDVYWIDDENTIGRSARGSKAHRYYKIDAPLERAGFGVAGHRLFIASQEILAEFFPRDGSLRLLASTRRRPAASKLDTWNWPGGPLVEVRSDGSLLATFSDSGAITMWTNNVTGDWDQLPIIELRNESASHFGPGQFLFQHSQLHREQIYRDRISTPDNRIETLLSDDPAELPRWPIPFDYPLAPGTTMGLGSQRHYDGTNFWILKPAANLVRTGTITSYKSLPNQHLTLLRFDPLWEMPQTIPLFFGANTQSSNPFSSANLGVKYTKGGLLMFSSERFGRSFASAAALWFVPWDELRNWVKTHCPDSRNIARQQPERRERFDSNRDGKLDAEEIKLMRADKQWSKAEDAVQGRRLLLTFDANNDDKLDPAEVTNLVQIANIFENPAANRSFSQPSFGRYRNPNTLLEEFDENKSGALETDEAVAFYAAFNMPTLPGNSQFPPGNRMFGLPAHTNFSPRQTNAVGPRVLPEHLRKYDLNTNGRLDPDEVQERIRDLKNRATQTPADKKD